MIHFKKAAEKQVEADTYPEALSLGENHNIAILQLQQENAFLRERNRNLEMNLARANNTVKSTDSELAARERLCEEKIKKYNTAAAQWNYEKQEIFTAFKRYEQNLQQAQGLHAQSFQQIAMRDKIIMELRQENAMLKQRIYELEQLNAYREMQYGGKTNNIYVSSLDDRQMKEEYPVNDTITMGQANKETGRYARPFSYNSYNSEIYLRGAQVQNVNHADNRVSSLEKKVDSLTSEISQLKESIQRICQILGGGSEKEEARLKNYLDGTQS